MSQPTKQSTTGNSHGQDLDNHPSTTQPFQAEEADAPASDAPVRRPAGWRRLWRPRRLILLGFVSAGLFVVSLPTLLSKTSWRSVVINRIAQRPDWVVTARNVEWGWFSPLVVDGVEIRSRETLDSGQHVVSIDIDRLTMERGLLSWYRLRPDLRRLVIEHPQIVIRLPAESQSDDDARSTSTSRSIYEADLRDIELTVFRESDEQPVLQARREQFTAHVELLDGQRVLRAAGIQVWSREPLTEQICRDGLQWVAPALAQSTRVTGTVSLEIDHFLIPLQARSASARLQGLELTGTLQLHDVAAAARNPLVQSLLKTVATTAAIPMADSIEVVNDTRVRFDVKDARVHHAGLVFVLPQWEDRVKLMTSGYVGFDESLELQVEIEVRSQRLQQNAVLAQLTRLPLGLRVTGTVDEPQLGWPKGRDLLDQIADRLQPDSQRGQEPNLAGSIGDLLEAANSQEPEDRKLLKSSAAILNIIRAAQAQEDERKRSQQDADQPPR